MKMMFPPADEPDLSIAPLIDMTFLLLVYFICTSSLILPEADLGFRLPGMIAQATSVEMPDEQMIEVRENEQVFLNDREFDSATSRDLPALLATLRQYKASSEAAGNPPLITILADDLTPHQRVVDVLNACATARITDVSFAGGTE